MNTLSLPKGTRDFSPAVMVKRNHIFSVITGAFERFGFQPMETPSMEETETLTGKYGDEGDKLIFRILDSGDYLKEVPAASLKERDLGEITKGISGKALRYDLTVPFARFVVMNKNELTFPFRRYQIQPVWRADRPQKGRYREFYQCDVDVIGTDSLLCEVELVQIVDQVLSELGIPSVIKINNRKILAGIAEVAGIPDRMMEMTVAIDKLDKIGLDGVLKELTTRGFEADTLARIQPFFEISGNSEQRLGEALRLLGGSSLGVKGVEELRFVLDQVAVLGLQSAQVECDFTLARGLNYYTGAIFEVKARDVQMGSICGGGRYDDLTGIFGLPGMSGVGISFGADRIFDVMQELKLFPTAVAGSTRLLFANFGPEEALRGMQLLRIVRQAGINAELYPEAAKMKKQFKYADDRAIPFVAVIGENELKNGTVTIKNMRSGEQEVIATDKLIDYLAK